MTLKQEQEDTVITGRGIIPEVPATTAETAVFDSRRVPVQVDFLQYRRVFPLSELMALQPGDTLPLPAADNHLITLEISGQRFAQGNWYVSGNNTPWKFIISFIRVNDD